MGNPLPVQYSCIDDMQKQLHEQLSSKALNMQEKQALVENYNKVINNTFNRGYLLQYRDRYLERVPSRDVLIKFGSKVKASPMLSFLKGLLHKIR